MHVFHPRFAGALLFSLLLHALLLAPAGWWRTPGPSPARSAPLVARLAAPAAPQPELVLPPPAPAGAPTPAAVPQKPPPRPALARKSDTRPALPTALERELGRHLHYPLQAIEQGLEGDVVVRIFLDESGTVIAARVEQSSGHALLDEAAVTAARALRTAAAAEPRDTLLPVRFRLR
ncbi:MAG: TonB family protein [Rhodocyclaceae bacterium]|nr:TonB family protein [Rhodocyclaceae bacterium]